MAWQRAAGLDVVSDGEQSKPGFFAYIGGSSIVRSNNRVGQLHREARSIHVSLLMSTIRARGLRMLEQHIGPTVFRDGVREELALGLAELRARLFEQQVPEPVDRAQRRVWIDRREIQFTFQEFELLAFLAAHPATVFTRAELVERVWHRTLGQDGRPVTLHGIGRPAHGLAVLNPDGTTSAWKLIPERGLMFARSTICGTHRSPPLASRWVANECRRVCGETSSRPADATMSWTQRPQSR